MLARSFSRHGHLDFVLLLLRNGAIVDSCLSNGNTPLIVATANGHGSVVQCLLEHGSDVNLGNVDGVTALHFAASNNRIGVAQMLFHKGVAVDLRTRTGFTPLHSAAQHGHVNFADLLMKNGADLNALSPCGHSVLHGACNNLQVAMVDFLLLHGADPNTRVCDSGDTPLISRCSTNRLEIIQLLLDNGADRYGTNPRARTSLFVADVITTGVLDARGLVYETVMVGCTTGSSTVVQIGPTVSHDLQEVCANKSCVNTERTLARQFRMCGRCRRNRYCSESCQSMDWKEHRVTCHDSSCRPVGMHIGHRTYRSLVAQKEQME
jgi:ankyrin repeat protein